MAKNKPDAKVTDPRSLMTDRRAYLPRSLHTAGHLAIFAAYVAKTEKISKPEDALKRVLELAELTGDYGADPTYAKAVENTDAKMAEE